MTMQDARHISASEFKATCLDLLDQIAEGRIERIVITKRGRPVATVTAPVPDDEEIAGIFGFLKERTALPPDLDLTAPVADALPSAASGLLHR
jgi:Phd_YefM.